MMKSFGIALLGILLGAGAAECAEIDGHAPSCIPFGITRACQSGATFDAFPGRYTMRLKIGDRVFDDKLEITYITTHAGALGVAEIMSGTFEVPTANFAGPIQQGKIGLSRRPRVGYEMTFMIRMSENGRTFPVYFYARGDSHLNSCAGYGAAYFDEARTRLLGTFTLVKDVGPCRCSR